MMMSGNSIATGFVDLNNLVTEVLYSIGDEEDKKYYRLILQKVINKIRNMHVHYAPSYEEKPVEIIGDLRIIEYPMDLVKVVNVGIYSKGEFFSFTRKPNMGVTATADGEKFDTDIGEGEDIPRRGFKFGARGFNQGYYVEDDKNRRIFIRNYSKDKAILRYRSNGIDCTSKTCVPYQMKDYIVNSVVFELASMRIPYRHSAAEMQTKIMMLDKAAADYATLEYEPQSMDEIIDAQYASYNTTIRR